MNKQKALLLIVLISSQLFSLYAQKADTISIYFEIDSYAIGSVYREKLKSLAKSDIAYINITGFTDFLGTLEANNLLSANRANAAKSTIISYGINSSKITKCEGKGIHSFSSYENRKNPTDRGIGEHRKAEIIIAYNPSEKLLEINPPEIVYTDTFKIFAEPEDKAEIIDLRNIKSSDLTEGKKILLKNINFEGGTPRFLPESDQALKDLLNIMRENPKLKIEIQGHICCQAANEPDGYDHLNDNNTLSLNRAVAVFEYLYKNGIDPYRMTCKGFGAKYKLHPLESDGWEQSQNRRVEIKILENE